MTITTRVYLMEGSDRLNRRVTLLARDDHPYAVVCIGIGETERVRAMVDNPTTRQILRAWYFTECPVTDFDNLEVVAEYSLFLRRS